MNNDIVELVSTAELSDILKVSKPTICGWAKKGMPRRSYGVFDLIAVKKWLDSERFKKSNCAICGKEVSGKTKICKICWEIEKEKKRTASKEKRSEKKKENIKACAFCGKDFFSYQKKQEFCSKDCGIKFRSREAETRNTKTCLTCGKTFISLDHKYCSQACSAKDQRKRVAVNCFRCGAEIQKKASELEKYNPKGRSVLPEKKKHFCSRDCSLSWQKENKIREYYENPKKALRRKASTLMRNYVVKDFEEGKWRSKFFELFGYTPSDLRIRLERTFKPGMSWSNYGEWHIDHIIPLSLFNYEKPEDYDFKRAWSLKNLQALWRKENMRKTDFYEKPFQPGLIL